MGLDLGIAVECVYVKKSMVTILDIELMTCRESQRDQDDMPSMQVVRCAKAYRISLFWELSIVLDQKILQGV
jgi:hypothetical protein